MTQELLRKLEERGYREQIVPIQHLCDLQEEIEAQYKQGLLDEEFYLKEGGAIAAGRLVPPHPFVMSPLYAYLVALTGSGRTFDDRGVRLAFAHLLNREKLMETLFFNEYTYIDSYFPGRDWGSPNFPTFRDRFAFYLFH